MNLPEDKRDKKASIIAAAVTFGAALAILVLLFILTVGNDRKMLAETSTPEIQDDEEIFLDPEMLVIENDGVEEEALETEEAAPQPPGQPDQAEEEQRVAQVKNEEPPAEEPVSNKPKLVSTTRQDSEVKTSTPKVSEEEQRIKEKMAASLKSPNNGSNTGKESGNTGAGGNGVNTHGSLKGRRMLSCSTWKVKVTQQSIVKVNITVNAAGSVTSATAVSGGTPNLRAECEKMAKTSKWTPQEGAVPANGFITFTINPN